MSTDGAAPQIDLRDWMAGQALVGMLASRAVYPASDWAGMASEAYAAADAMLAERAKERSK